MERALRALNKSKSPGADRIPVKMLNDIVHRRVGANQGKREAFS